MLKELVIKNRSYRGYDPKVRLTKEDLLELVDLTRYTASSVNEQPLRYYIAWEKEEVEQILPLITTDMTDREILGYAVSLFPLLSRGEIVSQHIPAPDTYSSRSIDGMAVLVADLEANRKILQDTLGG